MLRITLTTLLFSVSILHAASPVCNDDAFGTSACINGRRMACASNLPNWDPFPCPGWMPYCIQTSMEPQKAECSAARDRMVVVGDGITPPGMDPPPQQSTPPPSSTPTYTPPPAKPPSSPSVPSPVRPPPPSVPPPVKPPPVKPPPVKPPPVKPPPPSVPVVPPPSAGNTGEKGPCGGEEVSSYRCFGDVRYFCDYQVMKWVREDCPNNLKCFQENKYVEPRCVGSGGGGGGGFGGRFGRWGE